MQRLKKTAGFLSSGASGIYALLNELRRGKIDVYIFFLSKKFKSRLCCWRGAIWKNTEPETSWHQLYDAIDTFLAILHLVFRPNFFHCRKNGVCWRLESLGQHRTRKLFFKVYHILDEHSHASYLLHLPRHTKRF